MAAFVVIELIIHRNAQHGFYTLLSCHHYDGAACLFSSAIKLLMNALSVAIASLIKLNFIQRNETHFSWCSSNKCNAAVHTRILSVSMTLRCFFNRFNIDKEQKSWQSASQNMRRFFILFRLITCSIKVVCKWSDETV